MPTLDAAWPHAPGGDILLYITTVIVLLGSPGPGIAALLAVGRERGLAGALRFYLGMQLGLAIAAGLSVAGLAAALGAVPLAARSLTLVGAAYLAWLAWRIATAPVGSPTASGAVASAWGGFLLGAANPKVYLALVSLFASFRLVGAGGATAEYRDALLKWTLCIGVTAIVDLGWLGVGVGLGRVALSPRAERVLNVVMGGTIVLAAAAALR